MKKSVLIFLILPFISCSLFTNENDGLEQAVQKWEESKSTNYEFDYHIGCFCVAHTPAKIIVLADTIYQVLNPDTRDSLMIEVDENTFKYAGEVFKDSYKTIDELFDVIRDARKRNAHTVSAEYNSENGIPESISIDYIKEAADDEIGYTVSNYMDYVVRHQGK